MNPMNLFPAQIAMLEKNLSKEPYEAHRFFRWQL